MSQHLSGRFWEIASRLLDNADEDLPSELGGETQAELEMRVRVAKEEWLQAQNYFDQATEPELVDHAILSLQAAERKYMYWLKQMKNSQ